MELRPDGRVPWEGSDRRERLPDNWDELRAEAHRLNPRHICHLCGESGGDALDHKQRGDDHRQENLDWAHDKVPPHCHRRKSGREGAAARAERRRAMRLQPERHPAFE